MTNSRHNLFSVQVRFLAVLLINKLVVLEVAQRGKRSGCLDECGILTFTYINNSSRFFPFRRPHRLRQLPVDLVIGLHFKCIPIRPL